MSDRRVIAMALVATVFLLACALVRTVVPQGGAAPWVVLLVVGLAAAAVAVRGAWAAHGEQR